MEVGRNASPPLFSLRKASKQGLLRESKGARGGGEEAQGPPLAEKEGEIYFK